MITNRLENILNHISGKTMADIGTDHAYIPISLVKDGLVEKAIACDIKPGPLAIAEQNVKKYGFSEKIELRLGAGLEPLAENEVESVVIAGMGGEMIINILKNEKSRTFLELILQPMNYQAELRLWLLENDFTVILEDLSSEGFKVYNLLKVTPKKDTLKYTGIDVHLPKSLRNHPLFPMLYEKKKREFTKILTGLKMAENKDFDAISKYENLLKEMENL